MGIDRALLTADEEAMLEQLEREKAALPRPYGGAGCDWPGYVWATLVTWLALWGGALGGIVWSVVTPPMREIHQESAAILLVPILIVGAIFPFAWMKQDLRGIDVSHARADANIEAFLTKLDYPGRHARLHWELMLVSGARTTPRIRAAECSKEHLRSSWPEIYQRA